MHSPEEIRQKALRRYDNFLVTWLTNENFFPLRISIGSVSIKDFGRFQEEIDALNNQSKAKRGYGYVIESDTKRTHNYSEQTIPHHIVFETTDDYLKYIGEGKHHEFNNFVADVEIIRINQPQLEPWLHRHLKDVIKYHGAWKSLLTVCQYFLENPRPQRYLRELPVEVHTKFIETHASILDKLLQELLPQSAYHLHEQHFTRRYGIRDKSPLICVRFLDDKIKLQTGIPFDEFAIPIHTLVTLNLPIEHCIIVENELNFLTLPQINKSISIWGEGFKVEILRNVKWLHDVDIVYWGDIDVQGFQILSNLRSYFPHTRSILMNQSVLDAFGQYIVTGAATNVFSLLNLTREERGIYQHILSDNLRLEQEHISLDFANHVFERVLSSQY